MLPASWIELLAGTLTSTGVLYLIVKAIIDRPKTKAEVNTLDADGAIKWQTTYENTIRRQAEELEKFRIELNGQDARLQRLHDQLIRERQEATTSQLTLDNKLTELEIEIKDLRSENKTLTETVAILESERKLDKAEILRLHDEIAKRDKDIQEKNRKIEKSNQKILDLQSIIDNYLKRESQDE